VAERLQRLEQTGGDHRVAGGGRPARARPHARRDIRIRPSPGQIQNVAELARRTPEVVECHRVTGEDCYVMRADLRDVLHLEEVIDRFTVVGQTTTSVMRSSPVPGRPVAVPSPTEP
jgi:Lrp/AsnC family transcriptional regulator, leucine-responsive regulatory protein